MASIECGGKRASKAPGSCRPASPAPEVTKRNCLTPPGPAGQQDNRPGSPALLDASLYRTPPAAYGFRNPPEDLCARLLESWHGQMPADRPDTSACRRAAHLPRFGRSITRICRVASSLVPCWPRWPQPVAVKARSPLNQAERRVR